MENLQKSDQYLKLLKLITIASLLIIAPLLSTSLRFKYLYFIVNILIIVVGAEAGLLSFFLQSADSKNRDHVTISPLTINKENYTHHSISAADHKPVKKKPVVVGKCSSEKILGGVKEATSMKKSPSSPSIFFIGEDTMKDNEREEEEVDEDLSGQELFQKAEIFIGDFYKQLKMQREESWKKLHDRLSLQKAF